MKLNRRAFSYVILSVALLAPVLGRSADEANTIFVGAIGGYSREFPNAFGVLTKVQNHQFFDVDDKVSKQAVIDAQRRTKLYYFSDGGQRIASAKVSAIDIAEPQSGECQVHPVLVLQHTSSSHVFGSSRPVKAVPGVPIPASEFSELGSLGVRTFNGSAENGDTYKNRHPTIFRVSGRKYVLPQDVRTIYVTEVVMIFAANHPDEVAAEESIVLVTTKNVSNRHVLKFSNYGAIASYTANFDDPLLKNSRFFGFFDLKESGQPVLVLQTLKENTETDIDANGYMVIERQADADQWKTVAWAAFGC